MGCNHRRRFRFGPFLREKRLDEGKDALVPMAPALVGYGLGVADEGEKILPGNLGAGVRVMLFQVREQPLFLGFARAIAEFSDLLAAHDQHTCPCPE